ncbi:MAG: hypothetical protein KKC20_18475 [Proteobacteria bacterium]|nr:hypothetical protein [Pseudomonadota bacterium]
MPQGVVAINREGNILEVDPVPLKRKKNIFDYMATEYDFKALKLAIKKTNKIESQVVELRFLFLNQRLDFRCIIFFEKGIYLIGTWWIPQRLLQLPNGEDVAW